jgi:ligand-binding sensor domain-containing protein/signal transduction histidine kinase
LVYSLTLGVALQIMSFKNRYLDCVGQVLTMILMRLFWVFLVFSIISISSSSFANSLQRLRFDHISIDQGLPSTGVTSIYQTKNGFVWIGTANGLARYDGRHILLFPSSPDDVGTLSHSRVLSLFEDQNQMLWVGTRSGIDRLNLSSDQVERIDIPAEIKLKSRSIYGILQTSNKKMWLASAGGLLILDKDTLKIRRWDTSQVSLKSEISAVVSDRAGGIWFGQGHELIHIDGNERLLERIDLSKQISSKGILAHEKVVRSLAFTAQGELWVGLVSGVLKFQVEQKTGAMHAQELPSGLELPKTNVTAILQDRENSMWFALGEDHGLFRWNTNKNKLENYVHKASVSTSLSGNSLTSLMLDASGGLWVGTTDYGVNLVDLNRQGFTTYLHIPEDPRSLSHPLVTALLPDGNDFVWAGTLGGGLNRVNLSTGEVERLPHMQVGVDFIRVLMRDGNHKIWIGAENLVLFDPIKRKSQHVLPKQTFPIGTRFTSLVQDQSGTTWAGTSMGLYKIKKDGSYTVYRSNLNKPRSLNDDAIDSLLIDRDKRLWVGSKGGLFLFDVAAEQFHLIGQPSQDLNNIERLGVSALRQDGKGRIWAATLQGLLEVRLHNQNKNSELNDASAWELVSWKKATQLPDDVIESMQDADNGEIWMSSERGLMRLRPDEKQGWNFPSFGHFEGAFNFSAAARSENGSLYFGGVGLVSLHPQFIRANSVAPKIVLSDILLFNQSLLHSTHQGMLQIMGQVGPNTSSKVEPGEKQVSLASIGVSGPLHLANKIQLDHHQSMISFELTGLHFYNYSQNSYAWKLEGYDKNWIKAQMSRGVATYTNLDPGTYTLFAKAANPDGVWGEETRLLIIEVLPPYWRTWWWYLSWIIAALSFSFWFYRRRLSSIRKNERYLAEQVKQQTQEILSQKQRADQQRELAERARNDIGRLSEIGLKITASLDVTQILDTLYSNIRSLVDASTVGVGFVDWDKRRINFDYTMQGNLRILPYSRSLDALDQPATQCVLEGREFIIEHIEHECAALDAVTAQKIGKDFILLENGSKSENSRSAIYVPIVRGGQVVAVIGVLNEATNSFTHDDLTILRTLGTYTAVACDNARAFRQLELTQSKLVEQEKMAALGSLVAGVAHELNTPLGNGLLMASSMHDMTTRFLEQVRANNLRRSELEKFCDSAITSSNILVRNLTNAATLVTSFKQIAVDQTSDQRRVFDLRTFCEDVVHTLSSRIKHDGHTLQLDIPANVEMDSYPGSLGQVLSNLIINAIVHGYDGVKNKVLRVDVALIENNTIRLSVSDNGHGITEENMTHIFEPFFTTRLGKGGSGLGLHICYNIVSTMLGGTIEVESHVGVGTTFSLVIPRIAP